MYGNNIVNFQESTTILNACFKKVWKRIEGTTYIYVFEFFSFLLVQREKIVNILKLIGPQNDLCSLRITYSVLTFVYVSSFVAFIREHLVIY